MMVPFPICVGCFMDGAVFGAVGFFAVVCSMVGTIRSAVAAVVAASVSMRHGRHRKASCQHNRRHHCCGLFFPIFNEFHFELPPFIWLVFCASIIDTIGHRKSLQKNKKFFWLKNC